jgi:hypothetical protein
MAQSNCPRCSSESFEIKEVQPLGTSFNYFFLQRASCGAVVGVVDYYNTGALLHWQEKAIREIADAVGVKVEV